MQHGTAGTGVGALNTRSQSRLGPATRVTRWSTTRKETRLWYRASARISAARPRSWGGGTVITSDGYAVQRPAERRSARAGRCADLTSTGDPAGHRPCRGATPTRGTQTAIDRQHDNGGVTGFRPWRSTRETECAGCPGVLQHVYNYAGTTALSATCTRAGPGDGPERRRRPASCAAEYASQVVALHFTSTRPTHWSAIWSPAPVQPATFKLYSNAQRTGCLLHAGRVASRSMQASAR